jgi:glycosyltransferase involved in cell wall biosynthesis
MISLIIPTHNNLRHLKNAYASIKKHAPTVEVILLDDGSTDDTWDWIWELAEAHQHREVKSYRSIERVGHTILYDKGIEMATNNIVGIMHADMIIGPNYIENMVKHLKKGTVVAGTRIEPPLHPAGNEKIIQNFGLDFNDLNILAFEEFCLKQQDINKDQTSNGMFAPWIIYKEDFLKMGGHDHIFAPFPYEDSDIFERWILSGYKLIQSRDALVYHLTCRGHRWTEQVGKDDDYYKRASQRAAREYLRKWGSWIKNDEFQHPIIKPKYNIGFIVNGDLNLKALATLEPICDTIYIKDQSLKLEYLKLEQPNTKFELNSRVKSLEENRQNDIYIEFEYTKLTQEDAEVLQQLPFILKDSGQIGYLELGNLKFTIVSMKTYEKGMILPIYKQK